MWYNILLYICYVEKAETMELQRGEVIIKDDYHTVDIYIQACSISCGRG